MPLARRLAATLRRGRPGETPAAAGAAATAAAPVSCDTGLACLFRLGVQVGVYADTEAVKRRNLVDGPTVPVARLAALAGEFGLQAMPARLDWQRARRPVAFTHPLILVLGNANAVVLMGIRRGGGEELAVSDPLFRDGETFFLGRASSSAPGAATR